MGPTQETMLRRVADVVDAGEHSPSVPGRLSESVLRSLAALVPADAVTFADLDTATATHHAMDDLMGGEVTFLAEPLSEPDEPFWRHYDSARFCSYPTRTRDDRSVTLLSDFYTAREWKQTPMYVEDLSYWDVTFEMMCPLPTAGSRSKRVLFFRTGSHDFTEDDRFALALLRPHIIEMVGRGAGGDAAHALTERQTELMRLVADGYTNAEIASMLYLSPHTVRTHLMNIFERLGVTTRAAAVARLFST